MTEPQFNRCRLALIMTFQDFTELEAKKQDYYKENYPGFKYIPEVLNLLKATSKSNLLTKTIINYLKWCGYFAERINTTGIYRNGKYTYSGGTTGSADISAIINGQSVRIEVKIGRDKQSEAQKRYEDKVTQAGAQYWLVHDFTEFLNKIKQQQ